jgi:hypothetical protein
MARHRVDTEQAKKTCDAVRAGRSVRSAAARFQVGQSAITHRLSDGVLMDDKIGPGTVMTEQEENAVEDIFLFAARQLLFVGWVQPREAVRQLRSDGLETALTRWPQHPLGSQQRPGEGVGSGLPQEVPLGVGAKHSHLQGQPKHRERGAVHLKVLRGVGRVHQDRG